MRRFRLFTKALAILVLLFGITAVATSFFSAWLLDHNLTEQYKSKGEAIANGIAGASVEFLLFRDASTIQAMIDQYLDDGKGQGVSYIFVKEKGGKIVSHTFSPGIPPEIADLRGDRHDTISQHVQIGEADVIDISAPILSGEVGHVHVGMARDLIRQAITRAVLQQMLLMGLLFLLSVAAAYFAVRRLAEPLKHLAEHAKVMAARDAAAEDDAELPAIAAGTDEVGELAEAFLHMVQEVSTREKGLRRAQEELQSLNETLEQRVVERSAAVAQRAQELAQLNSRLETEISERKDAEADLRRERHLLDTLMNTIPDSIYFKDAQSRFIRINRSLAKRLSIAGPTDAVGKTDFDYFSEEHARPAFEDEQEVMRTGEPLVGKEEKETFADGREGWVLTTKMPLRDSDDNIVGTYGVSRDIHLRKQAQLALERSERRYRQLMEASLDAIVVSDQAQRILLFNPAAERIFGYQADEIVGQPLSQLIPDEMQGQHEFGFERYVASREARILGRNVEMRGRRKDGTEFPLELSISALDLGGELQFLGAMRDLTERNRMRAMMVQTEKLASIGQLTAGVAHEINNPLAYVGNNLVVLERDLKGLMLLLNHYESVRDKLAQVDPQAAQRATELAEEVDLAYVRDNLDRLIAKTREGVNRVSKIVQSMRGLARTAPPEFQATAIPEIIEMSLEMVRGQMRQQRVHIDLDVPANLPKVQCVPTQISQVLLNLVVNALHAIESAGPAEGGKLGIKLRSADGEFSIEIIDNGCGIEPRDRSRLFDPFFTTKPVGEGTGLGLSISHGIITGHGGRIEVESHPGMGSTFRVVLPIRTKN